MAPSPAEEVPRDARLDGYRRFSRASAVACAGIGILALVGWTFDLPSLKGLHPRFVTMKPNTALGLLLGGVALLVSVDDTRRRLARGAAAGVALLGLLTCAEYLLHIDLRIDELLFRDLGSVAGVGSPGRMSPLTAILFSALGAALLLLDRPRARGVVDIFCVAALANSGLVLAGYLYDVPVLYAIWTYLAVALHTAIAISLLSLGTLFARPDRGLLRVATSDGAGGLLARRLLPAALLVPPLLGWLRLQGELAGYYDARFGLAIHASANVVVFVALIFWSARSLGRLDDARRAQEGHLRLIVQHSPAGVAMFDLDLRYLVVSPRWIKDYRLEGREILGRSHYEIFPGLPEHWKEIHRRCLAGGTARKDEDSFQRVDGSIDWIRWEIVPWRTPAGAVGGIIIFSELITEHKEAEERFHATFEQAAVGIAQVDPDGRLLRVNQKFCDILGYLKGELSLRTWQDLVQPGGEGEDLRLRRKDGTLVWVHETRSLVKGTPDSSIVVIEDVSRRKAAEEQLRSLRDANLIGIVVADLEGNIVDANAAFLTMVGYTAAELGSLRLGAEGVETPREREFVRKDGSRVTALVGGSRVKGSDDTIVAFVLDLSERRRLEEQLRQSQRMEIVGRLAGGVAHDFNNLLTPILGYCDLLLARLPDDAPMREDLSEIRRSADRAATLTRQLLAFSRKQVLQPKVVDLNGHIGDAAKLLRRVIGEDIQLSLSLAPGLRRVKVDPGQMDQVLLNLAVNARDAMPGGGTLTIATGNVEVDAEAAERHAEVEAGPHVMVTVSDTGTGMTKEVQARLFEPFFTTKEVGKGTGLGLATVHGIVRQSRGHIWVYSEVGRGTTFKIYLPEEQRATDEQRGPASESVPAKGTETLLLVEDDDTVRGFAARVLRGAGYTVLEARSGEGALRESKGHAGGIDLLLTDVVMPGMSGREVARQLGASRPRTRVLYMSGYTEDAIGLHGVLDEGTLLLEKPFTPAVLLGKVREALRK